MSLERISLELFFPLNVEGKFDALWKPNEKPSKILFFPFIVCHNDVVVVVKVIQWLIADLDYGSGIMTWAARS